MIAADKLLQRNHTSKHLTTCLKNSILIKTCLQSNDLFSIFLDETMTYSCAIFKVKLYLLKFSSKFLPSRGTSVNLVFCTEPNRFFEGCSITQDSPHYQESKLRPSFFNASSFNERWFPVFFDMKMTKLC